MFTSCGVLHWLRDLQQWAAIIAHFLKPSGISYIFEDHSTSRMFTTELETKIKLTNHYFYDKTREQLEMTGPYTTDNNGESATFFIWNHPLGEVINSFICAGLGLWGDVMKTNKFCRRIIENLGYYVYLYGNPLTDEIYYIGRGKCNRAFTHLEASGESQKAKTIRAILQRGKEPRIEIHVHKIADETTALRIEAAAIDLLGKRNLANKIGGWKNGIIG